MGSTPVDRRTTCTTLRVAPATRRRHHHLFGPKSTSTISRNSSGINTTSIKGQTVAGFIEKKKATHVLIATGGGREIESIPAKHMHHDAITSTQKRKHSAIHVDDLLEKASWTKARERAAIFKNTFQKDAENLPKNCSATGQFSKESATTRGRGRDKRDEDLGPTTPQLSLNYAEKMRKWGVPLHARVRTKNTPRLVMGHQNIFGRGNIGGRRKVSVDCSAHPFGSQRACFGHKLRERQQLRTHGARSCSGQRHGEARQRGGAIPWGDPGKATNITTHRKLNNDQKFLEHRGCPCAVRPRGVIAHVTARLPILPSRERTP